MGCRGRVQAMVNEGVTSGQAIFEKGGWLTGGDNMVPMTRTHPVGVRNGREGTSTHLL